MAANANRTKKEKNGLKLIIQIPCYNEEESLPVTLKYLPKKLKGFSKVEWLIIDDGSSDNTVEVAKSLGVHHVVRFKKNKGLAEAFMAGLDACVKHGADVIINTDADNQYNADDIPALVQPILDGKADYVVGERPIFKTPHFSFHKKLLQKLGSWVVRKISGTNIPDAPSGFRAISREAAMKINVFGAYTYTIETIIQAGRKNIAITSIPVRTNEDLRPSRLLKSIPAYIKRSVVTMFRVFMIYEPFKFFLRMGILFLFLGTLVGIRYLYFWYHGGGLGHIQSVVLASILISAGFQFLLTSLVVDLLSVNRKIMEDTQFMVRRMEAGSKK
ncbi:MAG: glycosyltransferase family 2 protein [Spirochaetia bacterium]|jgi:glycosyltransferase involved in cell wall biosynthesis|nr:glycosyltransferase family 2 protein [Spirochaetia bacterium]